MERWQECLAGPQVETAVCEASLRRFLAQHVDRVEPEEDRSSGGPDFRCAVGSRHFYVECTCLTIAAVTRATKLSHHPEPNKFSSYGTLTSLIHGECQGKAPQASLRKDAPCLLAVGTLHRSASQACFDRPECEKVLTSQPMMTGEIDHETGGPAGPVRDETDLMHSAFYRLGADSSQAVDPTRRSVSGLLLCPFGIRTVEVRGVLHSDSVRPFDRMLLPNIQFCRLKDGYQGGKIGVEWT